MAEVKAILGETTQQTEQKNGVLLIWVSDNLVIYARFDQAGLLVQKSADRMDSYDGVLQHLRRLLPW